MKYIKNGHGKWIRQENYLANFVKNLASVADTLIPFEVTMTLNENSLRIIGSLRVEKPGYHFTAEIGPYFLQCRLKKIEGYKFSFSAVAFTKD